MSKPSIPLEEIAAQVAACHYCPLGDTRTNPVVGVGNPHARVLFIGEAPGKNEDLQGEPFVGAAGKYLNELLALAGLTREEIYIANVLKCRPPSNRNPQPEEIEQCAPFLREQTRTINPDYIVTMGNFATHFILKTEIGITRLHGVLKQTGKFKVFPVYHPAAAIYDRSKRTALEEDFKHLGVLLGTRRVEGARGVDDARGVEDARKGEGALAGATACGAVRDAACAAVHDVVRDAACAAEASPSVGSQADGKVQ